MEAIKSLMISNSLERNIFSSFLTAFGKINKQTNAMFNFLFLFPASFRIVLMPNPIKTMLIRSIGETAREFL